MMGTLWVTPRVSLSSYSRLCALLGGILILSSNIEGQVKGSACNLDLDYADIPEDMAGNQVLMALRARALLYGRIVRNYETNSNTKVYTAEMEVFCILKGLRTNRFVNISEAGSVPGNCFNTKFNPGASYIAIVEPRDVTGRTKYVAANTEIDSGKLDQVMKACELNDPTYPKGVTERNSAVTCPRPSPPGECVNEQYFTTTTTTRRTTTTPEDEEYPSVDYPIDPLYPPGEALKSTHQELWRPEDDKSSAVSHLSSIKFHTLLLFFFFFFLL